MMRFPLILRFWLSRVLCCIGIHQWWRTTPSERFCQTCGRQQLRHCWYDEGGEIISAWLSEPKRQGSGHARTSVCDRDSEG